MQQWESIAGATAAGALGRRKDVTECLTDCSVKQNLSAFSRSVVPRVCSVDPFGSTEQFPGVPMDTICNGYFQVYVL